MNKNKDLVINLNGEKLTKFRHDMALREVKMELLNLSEIACQDAMEQATFFEMVEYAIESYLIALQDNQLKYFDSDVEH